MGNDPPVLPSGPGEPPLQRAGLRGGTCGQGEAVVAAWEDWGHREARDKEGWGWRGALGVRQVWHCIPKGTPVSWRGYPGDMEGGYGDMSQG